MNLPDCNECRAMVADYIKAYRALVQEMLESRLGTDKEFAQAWHRARRLRTEEDVVLAEQLFPAVRFNSTPGVRHALGRIFAHETRTGHKARLVLRHFGGK
jgi:hypothetical protein